MSENIPNLDCSTLALSSIFVCPQAPQHMYVLTLGFLGTAVVSGGDVDVVEVRV